MSEVLRLEGVGVRLGARPVLDGVDLSLRAGELVGLLGCNGVGKTTLLRLVTRILAPERGAITLLGQPLESYARRELARQVALVPQETQVPFPFRAGEVVLMGRAPHLRGLGFESSADVEAARAAMARLGIEALADRRLPELSGGERQLVGVARALAQDPALLLLDEPTAFLDLRHRLEVLEVVRSLVDGGRSALVVSHDLNAMGRFADRLALLAAGRVLAEGPPARVLEPRHLEEAFGIEAQVVPGPEGEPLVVPRRARPVPR